MSFDCYCSFAERKNTSIDFTIYCPTYFKLNRTHDPS